VSGPTLPVHSEVMRVLIVGEGPVADVLAPMVASLGWDATATATLAETETAIPSADAVVVTSHHEDVDGPAIRAALAAGTPYVGAMGSRHTQARRREWLLANGVTESELSALHAPIGLDIGADEPGEIAISILAEIVAERRDAGSAVASISDRDGAIHPDQPPGSAYCPSG
jgi:xanthine/CO dehydrogenase XdhC/CoxF family maturation factor